MFAPCRCSLCSCCQRDWLFAASDVVFFISMLAPWSYICNLRLLDIPILHSSLTASLPSLHSALTWPCSCQRARVPQLSPPNKAGWALQVRGDARLPTSTFPLPCTPWHASCAGTTRCDAAREPSPVRRQEGPMTLANSSSSVSDGGTAASRSLPAPDGGSHVHHVKPSVWQHLAGFGSPGWLEPSRVCQSRQPASALPVRGSCAGRGCWAMQRRHCLAGHTGTSNIATQRCPTSLSIYIVDGRLGQ